MLHQLNVPGVVITTRRILLNAKNRSFFFTMLYLTNKILEIAKNRKKEKLKL